MTSILFVGDVVGAAGRQTFTTLVPALREELGLDFVVVNGENATGGTGLKPQHADELLAAGADVITLGNHAYRQRELFPYLGERDDIVRPANYFASQPGRGTTVVERAGTSLGVINLAGNLFMDLAEPALLAIDNALAEVAAANHVIVDMHAEATSEKVALGWYLDGKVTAVLGTHTHIPTADARILPGGTAYQTDVGMTGARGGVIGVRREQSIAALRTQMRRRYEPSQEDPWINAVVVRCDGRRGARSIEPLARPLAE